MEISKKDFKSHALEVFRGFENSGESLVITDRGKPKIVIKKVREQQFSPMEILKGRRKLGVKPIDNAIFRFL